MFKKLSAALTALLLTINTSLDGTDCPETILGPSILVRDGMPTLFLAELELLPMNTIGPFTPVVESGPFSSSLFETAKAADGLIKDKIKQRNIPLMNFSVIEFMCSIFNAEVSVVNLKFSFDERILVK